MTFPAKCHCGLYHYTFQHWSQTHGESKPFVDPYVQMPFVKDKLWNEKEDYEPTDPYPVITYKWVCQFCLETNNNHTSSCDFYLEKIKPWEDIKGGVYTTTSTSTSTSTGTSTGYKPKPDETKPKEEEDENTKKTLFEWGKDKNKISVYQYKQLFKLVDQKKKYTLTELLSYLPKKEKPKPKPDETPTPPFITPDSTRPPSPELIDPLLKAIRDIEKELGGIGGLFSNYFELAPYFNPETEINNLANEKNAWTEESWLEYLRGATDLDDLQGKDNNHSRKIIVLLVFADVMLNHYLEKRDLKLIDKFTTDLWNEYQINFTEYSIFNEVLEKIEQLRKEPKESAGGWDDVLDLIYNKFNDSNKPRNLNEVKKFVEKELKNLPKSGIDGDIRDIEAKKEDLLKLKKGSSNMSLSGGKGEIKDFSTWTALDSDRDGNCFLNSFSLLMKGDQTLATELRARMCLYLINHPELIGGFTDDEKLQALTLKLTGERDIGGKLWTLAKKGEWLATDDISLLSDMLQRPIRVLYRPEPSQFKDYDAMLQFSKITGGWGKLEYYEPDTKTYKKTDYWTICHVSGNHFEPLIPTGEDKAEPPTEINLIFQKLNNGVNSVIRGEVLQSEYLMSGDFENALSLLDKDTHKAKIYEKIKDTIFKKIGLKQPVDKEKYEKLPVNIQVMISRLKEIAKKYNGEENGKNYVDIYFEAEHAFASGGSLMIDVVKRPDGKTHIIGDAWKNTEGMINVDVENTDPQPNKYNNHELKRVFLDLDTAEKKEKEKEINEKGYNHIIYHVQGEVQHYDDSIKGLTFKKGAVINVELRFPL